MKAIARTAVVSLALCLFSLTAYAGFHITVGGRPGNGSTQYSGYSFDMSYYVTVDTRAKKVTVNGSDFTYMMTAGVSKDIVSDIYESNDVSWSGTKLRVHVDRYLTGEISSVYSVNW